MNWGSEDLLGWTTTLCYGSATCRARDARARDLSTCYPESVVAFVGRGAVVTPLSFHSWCFKVQFVQYIPRVQSIQRQIAKQPIGQQASEK